VLSIETRKAAMQAIQKVGQDEAAAWGAGAVKTVAFSRFMADPVR
jgi:hypothetical protein